MAVWTDQTLVYVDDQYDREYASNNVSRYQAYLRQNAELFRDAWSDEPAPVKSPVEFAIHAWRTATSPVMAPGYVRVRPDLHQVTLHRDDDDGSLYADIHVPLRHRHIGGDAKRFPYAWQDWATDRDFGDGDYEQLVTPDSTKTPSVLASAIVRVPGRDWPYLVTPTAYEGRILLDEAREAVRVVAQHINDDAAPIVARLLG